VSALAPFLTGDLAELATIMDPLAERGWLSGDELTPAGRAALDTLTTKVQEQRRRVTAGVSDQEYVATVGVLRRMAANLS